MSEAQEIPSRVMPEPIMRGSTSNPSMGQLVMEFERVEDRYASWAGRTEGFEMVLGHFIPPFQRPAVWSREQNIAFVENAWRGIHLGTYVVNSNMEHDANTGFHRTDRWLIDGQQRLRALQSYFLGEFSVLGHFWSSLRVRDKRRFESLDFSKTTIHEADEGKLRFLYDCLNFAGVAHTLDQAATPEVRNMQGLS